MPNDRIYDFFYQRKWPNGFECPRCGHRSCSTIVTRKLPLYQCGLCRHQTSLKAGTVMEGSRASLEKWAAAFQLLASTPGVNAAQLSDLIGVTYKTAWNMLRSVRRAIGAVEAESPLRGEVCAGLSFKGRWFYQPYTVYPDERSVIAAASVDPETGMPQTLKLQAVPREHLTQYKEITRQGKDAFRYRYVHPSAGRFTFLKRVELHWLHPLAERFEDARRWLNGGFRGLGAKSIQPYLDEYCFRFNVKASGKSLTDQLLNVCIGPKSLPA